MLTVTVNEWVDVETEIEIVCECGEKLKAEEVKSGKIIVTPCIACAFVAMAAEKILHPYDKYLLENQRGMEIKNLEH